MQDITPPNLSEHLLRYMPTNITMPRKSSTPYMLSLYSDTFTLQSQGVHGLYINYTYLCTSVSFSSVVYRCISKKTVFTQLWGRPVLHQTLRNYYKTKIVSTSSLKQDNVSAGR